MLDDDIHVWRVSLKDTKSIGSYFIENLSKEEQERAESFHFEKDRIQYVVSHYALRYLLAAYVGCDANILQFEHNSFGKPFVKNSKVSFNLSHSGNIALIAITQGIEVGVDVEKVEREIDYLNLAKSFFSQSEYMSILSAVNSEQLASFYRCWTGKEAIVKAYGKGLSIPLDSFSIDLGCHRPYQVVELKAVMEKRISWRLRSVEMDHNFFASIAYEDYKTNLLIRDWSVGEELQFN